MLVDTENSDQISASDVAIDFIQDYGQYVNGTKLPSLIDGLKVVHRIIIYVLGTTVENDKVNAVVGKVMARHPHGDQAVGDALIRLAQPFNTALPLVCIQGNVGSYSGKAPAHGRYLDVQSSEFTRDVYFNGINPKTFTYTVSQNPNKGLEPAFFIPKIPMALLTGSFAIAVGYSMFTPPLNFVSLCELTKEFIRRRSVLRNPRSDLEHFAKHLIPDYFSPGVIRNHKTLLAEYRKGNLDAPVLVDGILTVSPTNVSIRAIPYGESIDDLFNKLRMSMRDKDSLASQWFQELPNDRSTARAINDSGEITMDNIEADMSFPLKRGLSPFAILDQLKGMMHFTRQIRPTIMGLNAEGKRVDADPLQVLELWYEARYRSMMSNLCYTQTDLIEELLRLDALMIINGHGEKITNIFHHAANVQEVVTVLMRQFPLSMTQAEYLSTLRLGQLTRKGKDELVKSHDEVKAKLKDLQRQFSHIDERMIEEVDHLEKKYRGSTPRKTKIADYAGFVKVLDGVIQYWDDAELQELIERWSVDAIEIYPYLKGSNVHYALTPEGIVEDDDAVLPKEMRAETILCATAKLTDTVMLREHKLLRIKGLWRPECNEHVQVSWVGEHCLTLSKNGKIGIGSSVDIPIRRNLSAMGSSTDVIQVLNCPWSDVIVVHVNGSESNSVRIQRVKDGDRLLRSPVGVTHILGIYPVNQSFIINVPDKILNRVAIKHIIVPELGRAMSSGAAIRLFLNTKKTDSGATIDKDKTTGLYKLTL